MEVIYGAPSRRVEKKGIRQAEQKVKCIVSINHQRREQNYQQVNRQPLESFLRARRQKFFQAENQSRRQDYERRDCREDFKIQNVFLQESLCRQRICSEQNLQSVCVQRHAEIFNQENVCNEPEREKNYQHGLNHAAKFRK